MKRLNLVLFIIVLISMFFACSKDEMEDVENAKSRTLKSTESVVVPADICNNQPVILDLIAGQYMDAGSVSIVNDDENIYVTFETNGGCLEEVHVFIGDLGDVPTNKKNTPVPGKFPYAAENINESTFTLAIPLDPDWECPIVLAHAQLCNGETAWGKGDNNYFTLKFWYNNEEGFAFLEVFDQFYFGDNWCDKMGVIQLTDDVSLNLLKYSDNEPIGTVDIDVENETIDVNINLNPGYSPYSVYAFLGTLEELNSYGYCPRYYEFPYQYTNGDATSFQIPSTTSSLTFENIFGSPRWGFLGEYCIAECPSE